MTIVRVDIREQEHRGLVYADSQNQSYYMEYNHPVYGWLPYSCTKDDVDYHCREVWAWIKSEEAGDIGPYVEPEPVIPSSVSARQFRLQLRVAGIRDQVLAFVAQQSGAVQDAFEYSGSFLRDDAMMQAGFAALGFTQEQQDQFWSDAAKL